MRFPILPTLGAALLATTAVFPVLAADHKDAPYVSERPPADINDVYIFRRGSELIVGMTVNGVSDPDFNGTYNFSVP